MNELTPKEYNERFVGTESSTITLLVVEVNSHRREIARLRNAIKQFCDGQASAVELWKDQPHIKPLFDIAEGT